MFQILNLAKKASRSTARMSDQKRLVMVISTHDVPHLSALMHLAVKQCVGPNEMIRRIRDSVRTLHPDGYSVKSFTDIEKKLMRCMKRSAGRKGVYALSKALGLPSLSTIRVSKHLRFVPSVAAPKPAEIRTNIHTFFGEASANSTFRTAGHSLMIDGIHLSQRACWYRPSNQIIGLCREDSGPFNLVMNNMASVLKVVDAVHDKSPTCHYGREATVLAIAAFRDDNYHSFPIGQTQTCKSEKAAGFAAILKMAIDQWNIHGAPHNRPLFTIGTDGDLVFH
ncbi:hypothetical protein FB451DRAFT_1396233 [Mycena latifolia]|nr:hypothetical protein FB451DRAFT_1396233 [Mycena latifolia]